MASQLILAVNKGILQKVLATKVVFQPCAAFHSRERIGKREVVGFGMNGEYLYIDRPDIPTSAIRFQEDSSVVAKLREKEKGDWNKLTLDEKKTLYRSSFRQTYAEMRAPSGDWKYYVGGIFISLSLMLLAVMWIKTVVYPPLPYSMTPEHQQKMLMIMLERKVDAVDGLSSRYDYENKRWK